MLAAQARGVWFPDDTPVLTTEKYPTVSCASRALWKWSTDLTKYRALTRSFPVHRTSISICHLHVVVLGPLARCRCRYSGSASTTGVAKQTRFFFLPVHPSGQHVSCVSNNTSTQPPYNTSRHRRCHSRNPKPDAVSGARDWRHPEAGPCSIWNRSTRLRPELLGIPSGELERARETTHMRAWQCAIWVSASYPETIRHRWYR